MEFSLDNVDCQISLSNTKSEEGGVAAERYKAELKAGPKKVVLEKTINGGDVDYNFTISLARVLGWTMKLRESVF